VKSKSNKINGITQVHKLKLTENEKLPDGRCNAKYQQVENDFGVSADEV